jgi:ribonuclease Y
VIVAAAFAVAAVLYARRSVAESRVTHDVDAERRLEQVRTTEQEAKSVLLAAKEEAARRRDEAEAEVRERRAEIARLEQRTNQREEGLERRLRELDSNEQRLTRREAELETLRQTVEDERALITTELERVAALS